MRNVDVPRRGAHLSSRGVRVKVRVRVRVKVKVRVKVRVRVRVRDLTSFNLNSSGS